MLYTVTFLLNKGVILLKLFSHICVLALLLSTLFISPTPVVAQENASPQQLKQLRQRIQRMQAQHDRDLRKRDRLSHTLQQQDKRIAELAREQQRLKEEEQNAKQRLNELETQQAQMADEQSTQLSWLKKTAQALYQQGREPTLKLLLSQQEPDQVSRLLRYHDYFQQARKQRLDELREELTELLAVAKAVRNARAEYQQQQRHIAQQQQRIEAAQKERKNALEELNRSLSDQASRIARMRQDAERLDGLLQDMQKNIADVPANPSGAPFAQLRGKLPWPAKGTIKARYNSVREGNIRWSGVLLDVPDGTPVKAIHGGRVTYVDWVRGYGLITIIDHGNGYLSLYGHSQTLLKEVGDWVQPGEVIALAGNSGSADRSGVYLEIRKNGQPLNPSQWCR